MSASEKTIFPQIERLFEMTRDDREDHAYTYVTQSRDGWILTLRFEKPRESTEAAVIKNP